MSQLYKVWWPDRGQTLEDAQNVKAFDYENAAAKWADWYDWYDYHSSDYSIVGGETAEVSVLADGGCTPVTVNVFGEMSRSYRARLATQAPTPGEAK